MEATIEPTGEQVKRLAASADTEPIVMVNLLRFKDVADGIDAEDGISGEEAYGRYGAAVAPFLEAAGGRILAATRCEEGVIGPEGAEWDMVVLARYPSRKAFLTMATDPEYLKIHAHRVAALADSRLILSKEMTAG